MRASKFRAKAKRAFVNNNVGDPALLDGGETSVGQKIGPPDKKLGSSDGLMPGQLNFRQTASLDHVFFLILMFNPWTFESQIPTSIPEQMLGIRSIYINIYSRTDARYL